MNIIYSQNFKQLPIQHAFLTKSYSNSDRILFPNQNHTNNVVSADYLAHGEADAILTAKKNIRIGIKTADCVPILLFEKQKGIIAAVHAGWRGTLNQILTKTVQSIIAMEGDPTQIYASLGPAIGDCCYDIVTERAHYFDAKFITHKNNKTFLNLKKANVAQLTDMQIPFKNIESTPWCTSCNSDMFYSYRKEKPLTKQNISYIELN